MGNIIYHGTIYNFKEPSLFKCKDRKDFGKGFYLAIDISHARDIATKNYALHGYKEKTILTLGGKEYVKNYHGFRICRTIYKKQKNY